MQFGRWVPVLVLIAGAAFLWRRRAPAPAPPPAAISPAVTVTPPEERDDLSSRSGRDEIPEEAKRSPEPSDKSTPRDLRGFERRFERLTACIEGGCDYPETDPHSYDFALNRAVARTLVAFRGWVVREGSPPPEAVAGIARGYLESADGHVQEAALDLIAQLPPSPANLKAVLEGVFAGGDPDLVEKGFGQLARYDAPADRALIDENLARALTTGAPFVAEQVSLQIAPFLNRDNAPFFRGVLSGLDPESVYRLNLETALRKVKE